jgi:hypothetical protein
MENVHYVDTYQKVRFQIQVHEFPSGYLRGSFGPRHDQIERTLAARRCVEPVTVEGSVSHCLALQMARELRAV